ncbi:MAG: hypothetical protein WDZ51_00660 [Pirellulaceae bacterium]
MKNISLIALLTVICLQATRPVLAEEDTRADCERLLVASLEAQGEWSSVHAAEYLLMLDNAEPVLAAFRPQADEQTPEYRIGVWRVLAQAEPVHVMRQRYIEKIRAVLLREDSLDRLHAMESLAKLQAAITSEEERTLVVAAAKQEHNPGQAFALWRLIQADPKSPALDRLVGMLDSTDPIERLRAGFVLGELPQRSEAIVTRLREVFASEEEDSLATPYLAVACGSNEMREVLRSSNPAWQAVVIKGLVTRGEGVDLEWESLPAEDQPLALRMAVAFAMLSKLK